MITKMCVCCEEEKDIIKFNKHTNGNRRNVCEQCRNVRKRAHLWISFLKAFDFKCSCCGENDIRFLTLDHVQNDGYKDRSDNNSSDNLFILRRAKDQGYDKTKYDCLCYNCNCGKQRNNGVCPHRTKDKEEYIRLYSRTGEHVIKKGREVMYKGESVLERNKIAQIKHHVIHGNYKFDNKELQELINLLQK